MATRALETDQEADELLRRAQEAPTGFLPAVMADGRLLAVGHPVDVLIAELLSAVYQHLVSVVTHPHRDCPLVLAGDG